MKKTSLKDIAQQTGVSFTTVSIVLNGNGKERKISKRVIEEVTKVAEELNYRPNQYAKGLRTGRTNTLGLIVDDISNYFFGHLAKYVEEEAAKFGYTVMFCSSENNEGRARNVLGTLMDKHMDGYIIAPTIGMTNEIRHHLVEQNRPLVLIDRYIQDLSCSYVTIDNYKGAFDAVDYLIKQGYKNIALVTNDTEQIQLLERLEGYMAALRKNKVTYNPALVKKIPFKHNPAKVVKELEQFFVAQDAVDAVLFTSNNLGIPGLQSLNSLSIIVAARIGVICFDDHDLFRLGSPGITVVSQPIKTICKNAVQLLLNQIDGKQVQEEHVVLPPNMIIRDSTPLRL